MVINGNISLSDPSNKDINFCYFMGGYTAIVVVVGVIMNTFVIVGLLRFQKMDSYSMLVVSQGLCDLLSPLFAYPLSLTSSITCNWLFGDGWCHYYGFMTSFTGYTSIFNLTAFSIERFVTFKFPLKREKILNNTSMTLILASVWISGFIWALVPLVGISAYVKEGIGTMCSVRWHSDDRRDFYYSLCLIIGAYVLPMTIISACYKGFLSVIYSIMPRARIFGCTNNQEIDFTQVEKQQTFIVVLMIVWYNIAWFPYALVSFISVIGYPTLISPQAACFPSVFAKTSNIMNPIIYCFFSKNFRNAILGKNKVGSISETASK